MKKITIILALALSAQILLSGCSALNKQKDNSSQQSAQTQSDTAKSSQTTDQSNNTNTTNTDSSSTSTDTTNKKTSDSTTDLIKISKKDVQDYSTMTKAALIKKLGKDYKSQGSALTFANGLSFYGLNNTDSKPTIIKCNNNVEIMGIKNGMTFDKVQSILGKKSVVKTYLGAKTNTVYKIEYEYGKDLLKVISPKDEVGS